MENTSENPPKQPHRHAVIIMMDDFIEETGLSKTYVGYLVQKESGFYDRINKGGNCWPETQTKISQILADERAKRRLAKLLKTENNQRPKSSKLTAAKSSTAPDKDHRNGG